MWLYVARCVLNITIDMDSTRTRIVHVLHSLHPCPIQVLIKGQITLSGAAECTSTSTVLTGVS